MPIPDKVDFKSIRLIRNKDTYFIRKRPTHKKDIAIYSPCSHYQNFKVHEAKMDRAERRNRKSMSHMRNFIINFYSQLTKNQKRYRSQQD